jgi:hypothetical protein
MILFGKRELAILSIDNCLVAMMPNPIMSKLATRLMASKQPLLHSVQNLRISWSCNTSALGNACYHPIYPSPLRTLSLTATSSGKIPIEPLHFYRVSFRENTPSLYLANHVVNHRNCRCIHCTSCQESAPQNSPLGQYAIETWTRTPIANYRSTKYVGHYIQNPQSLATDLRRTGIWNVTVVQPITTISITSSLIQSVGPLQTDQ